MNLAEKRKILVDHFGASFATDHITPHLQVTMITLENKHIQNSDIVTNKK